MDGSCCTAVASDPLYLQLLGPGAIWIMIHCAGMCGPLVTGLGLGTGTWRSGVTALLLYQLGRALPLAAVGALAGLIGGTVSAAVSAWSPWLVLGIAVSLYLAVLRRLGWLRWRFPDADGGVAARLLRPLAAWSARHPHAGAGLIGMALSAMPCGIVFSTLGLATASGSPWHGAALMALLVALSTVPLVIAIGASAAAFGRLRQRLVWLPTVALACSATLLLLHGLAALGMIKHLHLGRIMLW